MKQKTAVPLGAAALSLAVLESDGRKKEGPTDNVNSVGVGRRGKNTPHAENVRAVPA